MVEKLLYLIYMATNLLIVESPNKIQTISHFLDNSWEVLATVGHIRDLANNPLFNSPTLEAKWVIKKPKKSKRTLNGIVLKNNPKQQQATPEQIVNEIRQQASKAKNIYIATDPDREGEAIAWHVYEVLDDKDKKKVKRITFNEITKEAVLDAIKKPRNIDIKWVHSQFTRRLLDKYLGYALSKIVRDKLRGISAGRVQSVALRYIYDREEQIEAFKSKFWYEIQTTLSDGAEIHLREVDPKLKAKFAKEDESSTTVTFEDEKEAKKVLDALTNNYEVYNFKAKTSDVRMQTKNPAVPFKTSTLLQSAASAFGWDMKKVTGTAQALFEGVKGKGDHHVAYISYPRTDSIRIADSFIAKAKTFIEKNYGKEYFQWRSYGEPEKADKKPAKKEEKAVDIQDAHEGIRVIDPYLTPDMIKSKVKPDEYRLYKLIWVRTMQAFMAASKSELTIIRFVNNGNKFVGTNTKLIFDGFRKISFYEDEKGISLKGIANGSVFKGKSEIVKKQTNPPPRLTQAALVKELEDTGVGRPSTYSSMAQKALDNGYAMSEAKAYHMLPTGFNVIKGLIEYFPDVVDKNFTKDMEDHLDDIAHHGENWKEWILKDVKPKFEKQFKHAINDMKRVPEEKVKDEHGKVKTCPKCGKPLVYKYSHLSGKKFISCSDYPNCNYSAPLVAPKILKEKCPICGAHLVERKTRRATFVGCSAFPKCHFSRFNNETNEQALARIKRREQLDKDLKEGKITPEQYFASLHPHHDSNAKKGKKVDNKNKKTKK